MRYIERQERDFQMEGHESPCLFNIILLFFFLFSFSFYIGATFLWKRLFSLFISLSYRCISLLIKPVWPVVNLVMKVDKAGWEWFHSVCAQPIKRFQGGISTACVDSLWEIFMQMGQMDFWLDRIKKQHRYAIDPGLDRVREVAARLDLLKPACPVMMVGGTNGKGSTVAGLEAIYQAAGYRVGTFTSPYLYRFNELVRIQGQAVSDNDFIQAFEKIDQARGETTLTQFEFNTLAALIIFKQQPLDVFILEVGLGGRLDAVNIIDADISVITSIAIDHAEWLGNTREEIALEKAGILRQGRASVCGDSDPPKTLTSYANERNIPLFCQDEQFGFENKETEWDWWCDGKRLNHLPMPRLALQNMSTVLMTVELMQDTLLVNREAIDRALATVNLHGRIEVIPGDVTRILDVSHNPASAELLANYLKREPCLGKTRAVFSMLSDKDIISTLVVMRDCIDEWYVAPLPVDRGASLSVLEHCFQTAKIDAIHSYDSLTDACKKAYAVSMPKDRVVVFGSFYTVAAVGMP